MAVKMVVGTALLFCVAYGMALLIGVLLSADVTAVPLLFWCVAGLVLIALVLAWLKTYLDRIASSLERIEAALEQTSR
ncbi:MAG: hypothetical protein PWP08_375 [Methanofollis sp.]|nr:hypothetical protein [Methanofollis sp.]